jgi:YD repeat-containing protein
MKKISLVSFTLALLAGCTDQEPALRQPEEFKLKAVQTIGKGWTYQEVYDYHPDGRINEIRWERNTPYTTQGVEKYVYDNHLRLSGMIREMTGIVAEEIRYHYSGSALVEARSYYNGVQESYTLYYYNSVGQLVKSELYSRNPLTDKFNTEGEIQYTYHAHGNVREIKQFVFDSQQSQLKLHSTRTYVEYLLDREAVLDSEPSLPTVRLQKNLPGKYALSTPSSQLTIEFSYRWMPDGKLLDRMVNLPNGSTEQTVYTFHP